MEFRGYRAGDFEALYALDVACFEGVFQFSRATMQWAVSRQKALVVVADEAGVAGFVVVHVERGGVGYVVTLDVAEAWRHKGVAAQLMRRVEAQARNAGCTEMVLHVSLNNTGAISFYERIGYLKAGVAKKFYGAGGDGWIYRKSLEGQPQC